MRLNGASGNPSDLNLRWPAFHADPSGTLEHVDHETLNKLEFSSMLGELNPCGGGDSIPLLHEKLLVGRRSSCDICLPLPSVSSHHCELELQNGYWYVKDLGSTNGIKVNGERTLSSCLMPGDELQVARSRFRIQYMAAPDAPIPEALNPMAVSLMEKAGLEKPSRVRMPESADAERRRIRSRRQTNARDMFLMEWLSIES